MYNYFYISNNQNKLLNKIESKYYKVGDSIGEFPTSLSVKVSGNANCINVLNGFVRNYVNNIISIQSPQVYRPRLIMDALLLSGFPQIYNHDIIEVGGVQYSLEDNFLIAFNTENSSATIDFKYIRGLK